MVSCYKVWDQDNERPDPAVFTRDILPIIRDVPLRKLQVATGLSIRYCSFIRRGVRVPHPRHWEKFRQIEPRQDSMPLTCPPKLTSCAKLSPLEERLLFLSDSVRISAKQDLTSSNGKYQILYINVRILHQHKAERDTNGSRDCDCFSVQKKCRCWFFVDLLFRWFGFILFIAERWHHRYHS